MDDNEWEHPEFYDIKVIMSLDGKYHGCEVAIAVGGPGIYIHTREKECHLYWGGSHYYITLDSSLCEALDDYIEQFTYIMNELKMKLTRPKQPLEEYLLQSIKSVWEQPNPIPQHASIDQLLVNAKYDLKTKKAEFQKAIQKIIISQNTALNGDIIEPRRKMFRELFYITQGDAKEYIDKQNYLIKHHNMKYPIIKGYCYAADRTKMRFWRFGSVAYVKPPKVDKGVWILKTGLNLMKQDIYYHANKSYRI